MNRNEHNSQTKFVFWLVAEKIHKLGGISPGVLWGYFRPQEGSNPMADSKNEFLRPICIFVNWVVSVSDNFALPVTLYSYCLYVFLFISYFLYISLESYFMSGYHFSFCFASKKIGLCLQMWLSFPFCKSSSEHPISYWHWSNFIYISTDTFIHCMTVESATKWTLITDSVMVSQFFYFNGHF